MSNQDQFMARVNDAVAEQNGSEHDALIAAYCIIESLEGRIEILENEPYDEPDIELCESSLFPERGDA